MQQKSVGVVYLCWLPYGIDFFKNFIASYQQFSAGYPYELIMLFNGVKTDSDIEEHLNFLQDAAIQYRLFCYPQGHDLEAYHWLAGRVDYDYLLFLNTYARLLADDWLKKFVQAIDTNPKIGMVGATGSWQSHYSTVFDENSWKWTSKLSLKGNFTKYKLLLKAFFLWRWYFHPFPNPHVRTNGFLIQRKLFCSIHYPNPITKFDAYRVESGRKGITQQVIKQGYDIAIIDRFGQVSKPLKWKQAHVFWSYRQENVLIYDNQLALYENASPELKAILSYRAWRLLPKEQE